jgi:hypothetical protein
MMSRVMCAGKEYKYRLSTKNNHFHFHILQYASQSDNHTRDLVLWVGPNPQFYTTNLFNITLAETVTFV